MLNTATVEIDLAALAANLAEVKRICPGSGVVALVKADAYGHGLLPAARAFAAADALAVARLAEAFALRDGGIKQRIVLLGTLLDADELLACSRLRIDVTAHTPASVAAIAEASRNFELRVWLELDTGMHRLGLEPEAFLAADRLLRGMPGVTKLIHMNHFSAADDNAAMSTGHQWACLQAVRDRAPGLAFSTANSAALLARPETRAGWVRPGIMLYGGRAHPGYAPQVRPAMRLTSRILAIRTLPVGESVGYHGKWTCDRPSRIATVGIGYGDGYPRHAPNGTPVHVRGKIVPLVGRVSMDSLAIDVTDVDVAEEGDEVVLWGPELPAACVADHAGTIDYALFTGVTARVTRKYTALPDSGAGHRERVAS